MPQAPYIGIGIVLAAAVALAAPAEPRATPILQSGVLVTSDVPDQHSLGTERLVTLLASLGSSVRGIGATGHVVVPPPGSDTTVDSTARVGLETLATYQRPVAYAEDQRPGLMPVPIALQAIAEPTVVWLVLDSDPAASGEGKRLAAMWPALEPAVVPSGLNQPAILQTAFEPSPTPAKDSFGLTVAAAGQAGAQAIPEPNTLMLLGFALLASAWMMVMRRNRRHALAKPNKRPT